MVGKTRRSIGDVVYFAIASKILLGRITCFYPLTGQVDVRTNKGHTYKVRTYKVRV